MGAARIARTPLTQNNNAVSLCLRSTMKIIILVALTFALIALVDRAPTKTG